MEIYEKYVGTVLDGEGAVGIGIIDELGSLSQALDALYGMIEEGSKCSTR